jgi:hypothetical protein
LSCLYKKVRFITKPKQRKIFVSDVYCFFLKKRGRKIKPVAFHTFSIIIFHFKFSCIFMKNGKSYLKESPVVRKYFLNCVLEIQFPLSLSKNRGSSHHFSSKTKLNKKMSISFSKPQAKLSNVHIFFSPYFFCSTLFFWGKQKYNKNIKIQKLKE